MTVSRLISNEGFNFAIRPDDDSGVTYIPWTDGHAVGFKVLHDTEGPEKRPVEFIYLNPSGDSDDDVPTVFVYHGTEGDPCQDGAAVHFIMDAATEGVS